MPIYEYRCTKGHVFDRMQRFSDDPLSKCEVCGASAQRVMHAPAVHFKGSGFYNTDYGTAKRNRQSASSADSGADKNDAKQAEKKSDSSSSSSTSSDSSSSTSSSTPSKSDA